MITSDHGGFAGIQPPGNRRPPANILSPELSSPAQVCLPTSSRLIGADDHLRAAIPSAGGKLPKKSSPPTTAASPEFGHREKAHLRPAFASRR